MTHLSRDRAESFGEDAELYDRARPEYPAALVEDLTAGAPLDVLDVGSGTGKAGRLFRDAGCRVLGVEIDPRMAAVARSSGLEVEVASFESFDGGGRSFDLVVSGQAWHWVDPEVGPVRAADLLRDGGRLAPFWNYRDAPDEDELEAVSAIYRREAPELIGPDGRVGTWDRQPDLTDRIAEIEASGRFGSCDVRRYPWSQVSTTEQWIDRLTTHSEHRLLGPAVRDRLFAALRQLHDEQGGSLVLAYTTYCIVAERR